MKKSLTLFIALAVFALANAQTGTPTTSVPDVLQVKEVEFDFGKIPQGKPVYHNFTVVNTGATALKLDNVQASCGCTTPQWSQEPIAAGGSTEIKVGYNAAAEGDFDKTITITYFTSQNGPAKQNEKFQAEMIKLIENSPVVKRYFSTPSGVQSSVALR